MIEMSCPAGDSALRERIFAVAGPNRSAGALTTGPPGGAPRYDARPADLKAAEVSPPRVANDQALGAGNAYPGVLHGQVGFEARKLGIGKVFPNPGGATYSTHVWFFRIAYTALATPVRNACRAPPVTQSFRCRSLVSVTVAFAPRRSPQQFAAA